MMYKLKAFYEGSLESASGDKVVESTDKMADKGMFDELKKYVLDNKKLGEDVKRDVQESVLNADSQGFDMDKIKTFLEKNGDKETKATIVAWQVLLKKNSLYTGGKVDGIKGPLTSKAIAEFKKKAGMTDSDDLKTFSNKLVGAASGEYVGEVQKETVTDDDGSVRYKEKTTDGKELYEGMNHKDGKIDAKWLENHKSLLADENNFKAALWGKTYKSDGSYEKITVGGYKRYSFITEMDRNGKGVPVVIEKMDKTGKNGEMTVQSWGNKLKIEVSGGSYKFVTPDPEGGGRFILGGENGLNFGNFEDVVRAADMINFAVHGVDKRKAVHPKETFDNFQRDGSGIDLDMHGNGADIQWIRSNAENYFGGAKINDIAGWMTKYYRSHQKGII